MIYNNKIAVNSNISSTCFIFYNSDRFKCFHLNNIFIYKKTITKFKIKRAFIIILKLIFMLVCYLNLTLAPKTHHK